MERYVIAGGKRLRCGLTTGTCAAAASIAAAKLLLSGTAPEAVCLTVPAGDRVRIPIAAFSAENGRARCCVVKDAGDDPDITDGAEIWAEVTLAQEAGIRIDGGTGVGRVTLPGLDQPVGSAAINSVPRQMIRDGVRRALDEAGCAHGAEVTISIPAGVELAKKTFNPRLGIVGGLSVLGTSGVVEPMSEQALVDSIRVEVRMRAALGRKTILLTPGNYGKDFLQGRFALPDRAIIRCSNYIGDLLDCAVEQKFESILLVGHLGKLVKLAGNMFNTHSRYGDCRMDILTAHAAMQGIAPEVACRMMASATVDHALDVLEPTGKMEETLQSVLRNIEKNLAARTGQMVFAALFTNVRGLLVQSDGFDAAFERLLGEEKDDGTLCRRGTGRDGSDYGAGTTVD